MKLKMIRQYNQLVSFGIGKPKVVSTLLIGNLGIEKMFPRTYNYICLYHEPASVYSEEWTGFKLITEYNRDQPLFSLLKEVYKDEGWKSEENIRKNFFFEDTGEQINDCVNILLQRLEESKLEK